MASLVIPVEPLMRAMSKLAIACAVSVGVWAGTEVARTAEFMRGLPFDNPSGMARMIATSQDGRVVYIATGTNLFRSEDSGAHWAQMLPPPSPPATAAPAAASAIPEPRAAPVTEPRTIGNRTAGQ